MMAAALADGVTILENAAREPEVVDMAECLIKMGAQIEGAGTDVIKVTGVERLHGAEHQIVCDRIEAGTYLVAAAMTGGRVRLNNARADLLEAEIENLRDAGETIEGNEQNITVERRGRRTSGNVGRGPHPA